MAMNKATEHDLAESKYQNQRNRLLAEIKRADARKTRTE
jgi:hypothetical protein